MNHLAPLSPDLAEPRASSAAIAPRSAQAWQIECLEFRACDAPDKGLAGFAHLKVFGRLVLSDIRIVVIGGDWRCAFPRRAVLSRGEPKRNAHGELMTLQPVSFPEKADWLAFSIAVIAAIRAAFPGALPDVSSTPKKPPAPSVAAA